MYLKHEYANVVKGSVGFGKRDKKRKEREREREREKRWKSMHFTHKEFCGSFVFAENKLIILRLKWLTKCATHTNCS